MGHDYYNILGLTRSAEDDDIKKAYRKLALKFHPDNNSGEQMAVERFQMLAEAYDVLSDAKKRAVYIQFGEEGLKNGVPIGSGESGAWTRGYVFHGDALKVFCEFFGGTSPFQEFYDRVDGDMHMSFGGLHGRGSKVKDVNIERDLALSLEEVYRGCIKKMKISRRVMNKDGHTSSVRDKILTINVKKGWKPATRITFKEEGDQGPNNVAADIVFLLKDKQHPRFRREGINLIYTADITLASALVGCVVEILTLDERTLSIPINDVIHTTYLKNVPGEGMPLTDNPLKKGDLIIEFNINFPHRLTQLQKEHIRHGLANVT